MLLPLLHGTADGPFLTAWALDPVLVPALVVAAFTYLLGLREARRRGRQPVPAWRVTAFFGGLVAVAFVLLGPLDTWNDELFFIHMLQHLILMIVAAPLLLLGRPVQVALQALSPGHSRTIIGALFRRNWIRQLATLVTHPMTVFLAFNLNLALWHLPAMYTRALESELVHEIEHVAFFATGLLFWWIIIDPVPRHHRASPHWQFGVCFGTCMFGGLVAAALTVSNRVLYPFYLDANQPWGLTALTDQKIGGGIMWISGAVYFVLMFAMLYRMVNAGLEDPPKRPVHSTTAPRPDRSGI